MDSLSPPVGTIEQAKAGLSDYITELARQRASYRAESGPLDERLRDSLLSGLRPHAAELKQIGARRQALCDARATRSLERWSAAAKPRIGAHPADAAGLIVKAPPYDFSWTLPGGQGDESADQNGGTYSLDAQTLGQHEMEVAAGVGFWFFSQAGNPAQRFAALCDYYDDWWDDAMGYTAHNDGRTYLWVFGASENAWVAQSTVTPSWSDGAAWFDHHGNDPAGDSGRAANETYFNAAPNSWYQCWIWSSASVDADSGLFGFADSTIHIRMSIPLAFMGSASL